MEICTGWQFECFCGSQRKSMSIMSIDETLNIYVALSHKFSVIGLTSRY